MAADTETVTRQSRQGYKGFVRLVGASMIAIVVVLAGMALFLL